MDDYNIYYLNEKSRQSLDTIEILCGLHITNTEFPTRVQGNSKSLFDYIITELPQKEEFQTVVSDPPPNFTKERDRPLLYVNDINNNNTTAAFKSWD